MLLLLSVRAVAGSYCSTLTSCSSCIDAQSLTGFSCHWCHRDNQCHELGSLASGCTFNNGCVSLSSVTTCSGKTMDACPASALVPEQIHIAFDGQDVDGWPTGMSVSWYTARRPPTAVSVAYGMAADALTLTATAATAQYLPKYGYHHRARLLGLRPSTIYYYQVSGGIVSNFITATRMPSPISVHVFGDLGYENSTTRPMNRIVVGHDGLVKDWSASYTRAVMGSLATSGAIDAVWHLGDIGYIDDSEWHEVGRFTYEETYNRFMRWIEPVAAALPYMVAVGNHESECHSPVCIEDLDSLGSKLANFTAFNTRWAMPSSSCGGQLSMWYSWNMGPVHFVSANSETDWPGAEEETTGDSHDKKMPAGGFGRQGEYLAWLEADLAKAHAARASRPWIVVGSHRPFAELNASHGELFRKYQVDVYFSGHTHSYERETVTFADGWKMLSVVVGGAGSDEQAQAPPGPERGAGKATFSTARYASGVLNASATRLDWRLIDSEAGTILDASSLAAPPVRGVTSMVELKAAR